MNYGNRARATTMNYGNRARATTMTTAQTMMIRADETHLTIATDIGNMHSRAVWGEKSSERQMIESYVLQVDPTRTEGLDSVYHVRSSSNAKNPWTSKAFLAGAIASSVDATAGDRVMDTDRGKAELLLPLLCALVWDELPEDGGVVHLYSTVHDAHSLGADMKALNDGVYCVAKDGNAKSFSVKVERVYNEGQGVLKSETPAAKSIFLLDVGSDTIIGSSFNGYELRSEPVSLSGRGVRSLITALMVSPIVKDAIKASTGMHRGATFEEIIAALENPITVKKKTVYRISTLNADITQAIEVESGQWLEGGLKAIGRAMKGDIQGAKAKLATGGGVMLPQVKQSLESQGFTICGDPLWANACGIFAFAVKAQSSAK
jgi:hypothetical protein